MFQHVYLYEDGSRHIASTSEARDIDADKTPIFPLTFSHVEFLAYAWPGAYEIHYNLEDGGILCHHCANDEAQALDIDDPQWHIVGYDINYEDPTLVCDHCGRKISPAYGEE
jgi:hypothetical protein